MPSSIMILVVVLVFLESRSNSDTMMGIPRALAIAIACWSPGRFSRFLSPAPEAVSEK